MNPKSAAAAIIQVPDGRYALQKRDQKRGVFFPGHWGLFGGALEPGESDEAALVRELREELGLKVDGKPKYFTKFDFDTRFAGRGIIYRTFFELTVEEETLLAATVNEGQKLSLFPWREVLSLSRLTPYDHFALWMHINRDGLRS